MALSHKDGEPPNLRIWLAEVDIDGSLDFFSSRTVTFYSENVANETKRYVDYLLHKDLNFDNRRSLVKCHLVQTNYIKRNHLNVSCHTTNISLTELSRSVWENHDLGRVYRPLFVLSVLKTSFKIFPHRPTIKLELYRLCKKNKIWKSKKSGKSNMTTRYFLIWIARERLQTTYCCMHSN